MKKVLKWILVFLAVVAGLFLVMVIWFAIRYSTLTGKMSPAETYAINDSVYSVKDRYVNAYLFRGNNGYLMVDACIGEKNVISSLNELGISADDVKVVLLTHSDPDHIGSVGLFKNASVWLHADEEQMITGQTAKMGPVKYKWEYGDYNLFNSDDIMDFLGLTVKVFHTPGHTPGSVCFAINDDYLVTGDNLIYSGGKYNNFLEAVNMDTEMQVESLKSLPEPALYKYILTAHNGIAEIDQQ